MDYTLIRSPRRRCSASLMVKNNGEVVVRAPLFMPKFFIDDFVNSKAHWIQKRQAELKTPPPAKIKHFANEDALKHFITQKLTTKASQMKLFPTAIKFKYVRSYWGSCAPNGNITLNLNLIYATPQEVEYIIVHELAHLKYKGHHNKFWQLVKKHCPSANENRQSLRQMGHETEY